MSKTFEIIADRLAALQPYLNLSETEKSRLLTADTVGHQTLSVNGEQYKAWRIVHSRAIGPGKGGIRFHPDVNEDEVMSLAFWMSLKTSLLGLPYGGAKGGVALNPKGKTPAELQAVARAYVDAFYQSLGPDKDIPAPDVYTNPQIMGWMLDQYERLTDQHDPAMITGKPEVLGGIAMRSDATARGGQIITHELVKHLGGSAKTMTVAVQGFGNAGAHIAHMLYADGFKVVAVSDSKGGTWDKNGLDLQKVAAVKEKEGSVTAYTAGKKITNDALLALPVDILVLAALENVVTKENAAGIQAKAILELANGPVTLEADTILHRNKVTVVPDILANAGGVVVSYFEWAQNRTGNILAESYLQEKLIDMMQDAWQRVLGVFEDHDGSLDFRSSAYVLAIRRILEAERARGRV